MRDTRCTHTAGQCDRLVCDREQDAVVLDTPEGIDFARLAALRSGLGLELKGLKMSRGRSAYAILKQAYGYKGSRQRVYEQASAEVERRLGRRS